MPTVVLPLPPLLETVPMLRSIAAVAVLCLLVASPQPAHSQPPKQMVDALGDPLPEGAVARLGTIRLRHAGRDLLGFAADGKSLLFHAPGAIHWMDVDSGKWGKAVRYKKGPALPSAGRGNGNTVLLSHDATLLVVYDEQEASILIVDIDTGKERKRFKSAEVFKNQANLFQARFDLSRDNKVLLAYAEGVNGVPLAWLDLATGRLLHAVEAPKNAPWTRARLSHDAKQVVATAENGNDGGRMYVYDVATGKQLRALPVSNPFDYYFVLRPDGHTLIAWSDNNGGNQNHPKLLDFSRDEFKEVKSFEVANRSSAVVLSGDGKRMIVRNGPTLMHWDIEAGKQLWQVQVQLGEDNGDAFGGRNRALAAPVLSRDGKLVALTGSKSVAIYDVDNGNPRGPAPAGGAMNLVQFLADGSSLVAGSDAGTAAIWDFKNAKVLRKLAAPPDGQQPQGRGDFFTMMFGGMAQSADGNYIAIGSISQKVSVWAAASGKHLHQLGKGMDGGGGSPPAGFAFAPQGHTLAVAGPDGTVQLYDAATGLLLRQWRWLKEEAKQGSNNSGVVALAFSPDGRSLAGVGFTSLGGDRNGSTFIVLWETATGRERFNLSAVFDIGGNGGDFAFLALILDQFAMSLQFSPDGKMLALGSFTNLHLVDTATGKDVRSLSSRLCIAKTGIFSRDGKLVFLGKQDGGIRVIDVSTGRVIRELAGHDDPVMTLALSPDGKNLASGSSDTTVLIWDMAEISKPLPAAKSGALDAARLDALWNDLASPSGAKAYQAIYQLAADPQAAVPYLKARLKPFPHQDPKVLDKLFEDLNSEKFSVREKANAELEKLGDLTLAGLQKRLAEKPTLEMRQRMEKLLAKLLAPVTAPELIRMFGAIEALERMGTPEAITILETLAGGAPGHRVTEDARDAARRLKGR